MNMGKLDDITHSSCGSHWECIWFQCAAAKLIKRPHIVNRPPFIVLQGVLVQAVLNTPNGNSGVMMDARFMSSHPLKSRTITPM